jgi:hypothetical protein
VLNDPDDTIPPAPDTIPSPPPHFEEGPPQTLGFDEWRWYAIDQLTNAPRIALEDEALDD